MSDEFVSYDEALNQLGLSEDEVNDLVVRNELRAFHEGDEVKFKREDIAALRRSRETEPTIVLSDTQAEEATASLEDPIDLDSLSTEETVLNIEGLLEDESEGTTPIPGSDLLEDDLLEGHDDIGVGLGDDTVLDTDELDLDLTDDDTIAAGEDETLISGGGVRSVQMVKKQSHAALTVTLGVALVISLAPLAILLSLLASDGGSYPFAASDHAKGIDDSLLMLLNGAVEAVINLF